MKNTSFCKVAALLALTCLLASCTQTEEAPAEVAEPEVLVQTATITQQTNVPIQPTGAAIDVENVALPEAPVVSTLAVVGDIMVHSPQFEDAYDAETDTYDFNYMLRYVAPWLTEADYAIGNLETTLAGAEPSGYPNFCTPDALAEALANAGFDLVSTANNHSLDMWHDGLVRTLDVLEENGIVGVGTYRTNEDYQANNGIYVADVGGIEVAFLSMSYGTNGIPVTEGNEQTINLIYTDYLTNYSVIDVEKIEADMAAAQALDVDLIAVMVHWGTEYQTLQNDAQEEIAALLMENGADLILGGHSHVLQPMEVRTATDADGNERDVFICWSLGNFISSQNDEYTDTSVILQLELTKTDDQTVVSDVTYVPLYMRDNEEEINGERYVLLDAHNALLELEQGVGTFVTEDMTAKLEKSIADCALLTRQTWDFFA